MKFQDYTQQKRAKAMRREPTVAEAILWKALRARSLLGFKFRRQVGFGPFIADFYCAESKLIIEADGSQHADNVEYDSKRTEFFTSQGIRVMRFWNNEIIQNLDGVLTIITATLQGETSSPSPSHASRGPLPLPNRERGT